MSDMTTIEIQGAKFEVDLRYAKRVDTLKVGDRVKVLTKDYSGYKTHHGVVIGFEPFNQLPTIEIAYLIKDWTEAKIEFLYYNNESKDVEVVKAVDDDTAELDKTDILKRIDREIVTKEKDIETLQCRKQYFLTKFRCYWEPVEAPATEA